jgi:vacuole morphology and inheritance protein 14
MVQNLNNNLITAPELAELRKRLRNLETKVGTLIVYFRKPTDNCRMARSFS